MKILLYTILFLLPYLSSAQIFSTRSVEQKGTYLKKISTYFNEPGTYLISGDEFYFNAIAIRLLDNNEFEDSYFFTQTDTFNLKRDIHDEFNEVYFTSDLTLLDAPITQFYFHNNAIIGSVDFFLINSTYDIGKAVRQNKKTGTTEDCTEPISVDQSVWRSGLPAPNYTRSFSTVEHVIVHHSAGSNSATNFTEVVRGIYIYHTEVNGWSDIGYNYLVAPDGIIFKGRDPGTGEQDNVIGAHFCGKNSRTMGICLLGTFTSVAPREEALNSLRDLITWKVYKDEIDPQASTLHTGNVLLANIAGHRDGCSTECPGQQTYNMLGTIRNNVSVKLTNCSDIITDFLIYPNPIATNKPLHIQLDQASTGTITVHDSKGSNVYNVTFSETAPVLEISLSDFKEGLYFMRIHTATLNSVRRIVVIK